MIQKYGLASEIMNRKNYPADYEICTFFNIANKVCSFMCASNDHNIITNFFRVL